ncbi:MAG: efflux RND transporter permease subunit [bacterium]|nr:efflux RND transporter permease subunit [bacterium]
MSLPGGRFQEAIPITIDMRIQSIEDLENIPVLHKEPEKSKDFERQAVVLLQDVAHISLGRANSGAVRKEGKDVCFIGVIKSSDGNPLDISNEIHERLDQFQNVMPKGVTLSVAFDKTRFIRGSLASVQASVIEAVILVILIVFLFLRSFRATLIPLVAIPLSLVGVMSLMWMCGLSVNTITLLAMVLAVGLVVDDAIVVLENIHRHIEEGKSPLKAAKEGSKEIGFAIVAMTLTLASVYAPIAFIQDAIGQVFFEFAITLAGAVIVSGIVALTFTPLMCGRLLKKTSKKTPQALSSFKALRFFDRGLEWITKAYSKALESTLAHPKAILSACVGVLVVCIVLFQMIPQAITPKEDRGVIGIWVPFLEGASLNEFDHYLKLVEKEVSNIKEAHSYLTFSGSWGGNVVIPLKSWEKRSRSAEEVVEELRTNIKNIPTIQAHPWNWDTGIPGVEQASAKDGGITVQFLTIGSYEDLSKVMENLRKICEDEEFVKDCYHNLRFTSPGYKAVIDRAKLAQTNLEPQHVSDVLSVMMDQNLHLEFSKDGLRYPIALHPSVLPYHLEEIYAFNKKGIRFPLSYFMTLEQTAQPKELTHYNQFRAAQLNVSLSPEAEISEGIEGILQKIQENVPEGIQYEFTGAAKKLEESSTMMLLLIFVALIFVYAILAIQFESFSDPFIIMFTVPLAVFGALLCLYMLDHTLDIFTQIGLVTLIGLITKHGILIVEFANQKMLKQEGKLDDIIKEAASLRLRPILMTTGAMVFGAVPLIFSSGAGAEARQAIGVVLVGGLLLGTLLTLFVIPVVYKILKSRSFSPANKEISALS